MLGIAQARAPLPHVPAGKSTRGSCSLSNLPKFSRGSTFFQFWQIGGGQEGMLAPGLAYGLRQTRAQAHFCCVI